MALEFIQVTQKNNIAIITLNRPEKRNAMHGPLIAEMIQQIQTLALDDSRVLLIHGQGENFCAGGDIAWMQKMATESPANNLADAELLADFLYQLYSFPKPTVVLAHGATLGGGMGLLAACDIAIAANNTRFGFLEINIGLTPSTISPYVLAAIGERMAHYYFLTGEQFDVVAAYRIGLVHKIAENEGLMAMGLAMAEKLAGLSPQALRQAKALIRQVGKEKMTQQLAKETAKHLADIRSTAEAQEGLKAFLAKKKV